MGNSISDSHKNQPTGKPESAAPGKATPTAGPWRVYTAADEVNPLWKSQVAAVSLGYGIVVGPDSQSQHYEAVPSEATCLANAHLCAAVHEMLDALYAAKVALLSRACYCTDGFVCEIHKALPLVRAALAKASPDSEAK